MESSNIRMAGVSWSSNCPDFTAHKNAERKSSATTKLIAIKMKITSIVFYRQGIIYSSKTKVGLALKVGYEGTQLEKWFLLVLVDFLLEFF